jgi:hypothetical protein
MSKRNLLPIIAVFLGAALIARADPSMGPNIVQNPGFETGDLSHWTISGDTSFTGVGRDNPYSGRYEFYSGPSSSDGFLDQVLPTVAGRTYELEFWLANSDSTFTNRFGVSLGGITLMPEAAQPTFGYTGFNFFVTPGANADLHFIFYNPPSYFYLDSVYACAVPEPGTLGLIVLGALGLAAAFRKRLV